MTNPTDILALQARVQQLEAALVEVDRLRRSGTHHYDHSDPEGTHGINCPACRLMSQMCETLKQALSTPPMPVSPLWECLYWAVKHEEAELACSKSPDDIGVMQCKHYAGQQRYKALQALTPELRALIEEMASRPGEVAR